VAGLLFPGDIVTLLPGEAPIGLNRLLDIFPAFVGVYPYRRNRTCVLGENSIHEQAAHPTIAILERANAN